MPSWLRATCPQCDSHRIARRAPASHLELWQCRFLHQACLCLDCNWPFLASRLAGGVVDPPSGADWHHTDDLSSV